MRAWMCVYANTEEEMDRVMKILRDNKIEYDSWDVEEDDEEDEPEDDK